MTTRIFICNHFKVKLADQINWEKLLLGADMRKYNLWYWIWRIKGYFERAQDPSLHEATLACSGGLFVGPISSVVRNTFSDSAQSPSRSPNCLLCSRGLLNFHAHFFENCIFFVLSPFMVCILSRNLCCRKVWCSSVFGYILLRSIFCLGNWIFL